jgi:hypothetical protein
LKDSEEDVPSFETILEFIINSIEEKVDNYNVQPNYTNRVLIENNLLFFMILTINLKSNISFIRTVFKGENNFYYKLLDFLLSTKNREIFLSIINNLFEDEYYEVFFNKDDPNEGVEELYRNEKTALREKFSYIPKNPLNQKEAYTELYSRILKFDLEYKHFFPEGTSSDMDSDEKAAYKLTIVQSLIRIIFAKEKKNYTNEKFFEFKVIKRVIDKDIEETLEKFGDQYKTLFRKEDICDDFLKYIFFIFGNEMMVESFVNPVKKELYKIGFNYRNINKEEFDSFVTVFIENLDKTIPSVLKILLKLLYDSVKSHFTIEEDNYGPLYTTLIFNYFISPRVQAIFNINSQKHKFVLSLNRVLRNACFNFKFSNADPLSIFNDIIEKNHLKIKKYIKDNIIDIDIESDEIKGSLENIFDNNNMIYPKFLFYSDINLLSSSIKKGIAEILCVKNTKAGSNSNEWVVV